MLGVSARGHNSGDSPRQLWCKTMLSSLLNQMNRICTRFICSVAKVQQQGKGKGELKRVDSKYNVLT